MPKFHEICDLKKKCFFNINFTKTNFETSLD